MDKLYFCVYLAQSFHHFPSDRICIFEGSPYCPRDVDSSVARRSTSQEQKVHSMWGEPEGVVLPVFVTFVIGGGPGN